MFGGSVWQREVLGVSLQRLISICNQASSAPSSTSSQTLFDEIDVCKRNLENRLENDKSRSQSLLSLMRKQHNAIINSRNQ